MGSINFNKNKTLKAVSFPPEAYFEQMFNSNTGVGWGGVAISHITVTLYPNDSMVHLHWGKDKTGSTNNQPFLN